MGLLALLRVFPEDLSRVRQAVPVDDASLDALLMQARLHGLSALLQHAVTAAGLALPPPFAARLAQEAVAMAGGTLRAKALLVDTVTTLAEAGVHPVLLKGYALGARLYPEPLLRPTSDVDLLVSEAELAPAAAALTAKGLRPLSDSAEAYHRAHHHHLTFAGPIGVVELHFRLLTGFGSTFESEPALARAQPLTLPPSAGAELLGRQLRVLSREDEALYLALHAANHLFARVTWLYDLKLLLASAPPDWKGVAERARALRLGAAAHVAFAVARRAVGAAVPDSALAALPTAPWHRAMASRVFTDARLEGAHFLERKWAAFALNAALASGPFASARFLAHHVGRGLRRRIARHFPQVAPRAWSG